jgi:HK97 family phage prohead protease
MYYKTLTLKADIGDEADYWKVEGYAAIFDKVDRHLDRIEPGAFSKSLETHGGVLPLLWLHNFDYVLGDAKAVEDRKGLRIEGRMLKSIPKAQEVYSLVRAGVVSAMSFGYVPIKTTFDGKHRLIKEVDIREVSLTPRSIAANPGTEASVKQLALSVLSGPAAYKAVKVSDTGEADRWYSFKSGVVIGIHGGSTSEVLFPDTWSDDHVAGWLEKSDLDLLAYGITAFAIKAATAFEDLPLAERDRPWDADGARRRLAEWAKRGDEIDFTRYRKGFFWYDSEKPELLGSYKLPFADVISGTLKAVPRGIMAAAAAIQGARGGVDIPRQDVPAVKRHIERYYRKMDLTPPWGQEE